MKTTVHMRRPVAQRLKYPGTDPAPAGPTGPSLSDVVKLISQVQQNQTQILNALNALNFNLAISMQLQFQLAQDLAPNWTVQTELWNDFNGLTNLLVSVA